MDFNEKSYDKIQRYLDNELTAHELQEFEVEMQSNLELAEEISLNQSMQEMLEGSPKNELRKNLQTLGGQFQENPQNSGNKGWYLLLLLPIVLWATCFFFSTEKLEEPAVSDTKIENTSAQSPTKESEIPVDSAIQNSINQVPEKKILEQKKEVKTEKKTPSKSTQKKYTPRLIAANFELNPSLEFLIKNNVRNNDLEIIIEQKQPNLTLSASTESAEFQFTALLKSSENLLEKEFKMHLFSNDKKAFDDFNPIESFDLNLQKLENNDYRISLQKVLSLKTGLYYYLLEDAVIEKVYFVEKFEVKQ